MDGWNITFLLGWPIFRCYVSFREGNWFKVRYGSSYCFPVFPCGKPLSCSADEQDPAEQLKWLNTIIFVLSTSSH